MDVQNKEIEKKFLIKYPDGEILDAVPREDRSYIIEDSPSKIC